MGTELRLCAQIGRRCPLALQVPALELSVEDTDDGSPRWTSHFSLFREPRLLIKASQVLRFFKYWSDSVPNNTFV